MPELRLDGVESIQQALERVCAVCESELPAGIGESVAYALRGEGKRLRPLLLLEAYRACGGKGDASDLAAAVEVVHAYSLAHDDLPCMDDDDMRRGRPTLHRVFGVPAATVAGVVMVPLAARCAWRASLALELSAEESGVIVRELMEASGAGGMVGGQWLDLEAEGARLGLEALAHVHRLKTGALIRASVTLAARAARASERQLRALDTYGLAIGLAFQIADDVLDVTASSAQLGKTAGRDEYLGKSTYPALLGVEGAAGRANELVDEGCEALDKEGLLTPALNHLARFSVERRS